MTRQSAPHSARLSRLLEYLARDPDNALLCVDAFDCALAEGQFEVAHNLVSAAREKAVDPPGWQFREASLAVACGQFAHATEVLESLAKRVGPHPAITHNLAYIAFAQHDYDTCIARLAADASVANPDAATQTLWLRALHHAGQLKHAFDDAARWSAAGVLAAAAAGVAALVALDADRLEPARQWSARALAQVPDQLEALVAAGSLALADQDAARAGALLDRALAANPNDGRSHSARGYAALLAGDLARARSEFETAVAGLPAHIGTWLGLGWACLLLEEGAAALHAFEAALALDRNFSESHGALAVALALAGDRAGAQSHIELARRLDANDLSSRYAELVLAGQGRDARALSSLAARLLAARGLKFSKPG